MVLQLQADLGREPGQASLDLGPISGWQHLISRAPLGRDFRMELVGNPVDLDVIFTFQLLDPDQVDETEGSDVV